MTQGGDDMSIEQKEAPGLVDEPTNDDELCGKEIAKLKAHIGMQITIAEMDGHETFNEWFHVYPSVERYEDNLHSAWIAGAASRNAKIEAQADLIEGLNGRFAKDQDQIACQAEQLAAQAAQIEMMREFIARAPVSSGVCCCGEAIDGHSNPMSCGHSPVDLWDHSVEQILSTTPDQALEQFADRVRKQCEDVALSGEWKLTKTGKAIAAAIHRITELPK